MSFAIKHQQHMQILTPSFRKDTIIPIKDILKYHNIDNFEISQYEFYNIKIYHKYYFNVYLLLIVLSENGNVIFLKIDCNLSCNINMKYTTIIKNLNIQQIGHKILDFTLDIKNYELLFVTEDGCFNTNILKILRPNINNSLDFKLISTHASVIKSFCINKKKFIVLNEDYLNLYLVDEDGKLKQFSKNINCYDISLDGERLYLLDNSGNVYYRNLNKNKNIIDYYCEHPVIRGIIKICSVGLITYFLHQCGKLFISGYFKHQLETNKFSRAEKCTKLSMYVHRYPRYTGVKNISDFSVSINPDHIYKSYRLLLSDFNNNLLVTFYVKICNRIMKKPIKSNLNDEINFGPKLNLCHRIKASNSF